MSELPRLRSVTRQISSRQLLHKHWAVLHLQSQLHSSRSEGSKALSYMLTLDSIWTVTRLPLWTCMEIVNYNIPTGSRTRHLRTASQAFLYTTLCALLDTVTYIFSAHQYTVISSTIGRKNPETYCNLLPLLHPWWFTPNESDSLVSRLHSDAILGARGNMRFLWPRNLRSSLSLAHWLMRNILGQDCIHNCPSIPSRSSSWGR